MSCCPKAPEIKQGDSGDEDVYVQSTEMLPGESVECYMKRAGNPTGLMDDKTEHPADKIENNDIPLKTRGEDVAVDVTFRLTPSSTKVVSSWAITGTALPSGVTFTNGRLTGTFPKESYGKKFSVDVTAKAGAETIDTRNFTFSPAKSTGSNDIKFVHPLPGGHVTSPFGYRKHPVTGINAPHGGMDFSVKPLPPADIVAAAGGECVFVGYQAKGAGKYLKLKHLNAAGQHLCTTVYMHASEIYVSVGQMVVAGQKIAKEGNTGCGTGPHLHFECRLPNETKIDPAPYIKGTLAVARETNPDNTAKQGTFEEKEGNASLTPENVDAKQGGCEPFGERYPKDPKATDLAPPANITDPFEKAWYFTLKHEVGPAWATSSPTDPEISAGLIATKAQQGKVGYVNREGFPGGETKFGVAQGPNPNITVRSIAYDPAKKVGYNNYWMRGPNALSATKPKTAIALFDMNYLHGVGNANAIKRGINIESMTDDAALEALIASQQAFLRNIVAQKPSRSTYLNGWLKRSRELLDYAKAIT